MQTQQNKENPLFLNNRVKNEGIPSICAVKQENLSIDDTCQLASPTSDSPVKRPLIDSQHGMATPSSKRIKQEWDDPSFWANKERRLLSSKTSLQNIVNEVANSFESNNCVKSASFQGFESSNRTKAKDDTKASKRKGRQFESSTQIVASASKVTTGDENAEVLAPSIDCHKVERSVLPVVDHVQAETAEPILRPLKSLDSGISDGYAFDHNFFPKLVGVHSALSPTSSLPELESHHDSQQTTDVPLLKKLVQNQETSNRKSSPLQNAENTLTAVSNGNFLGHCKDDKGHSIPKNTGKVTSRVTPLLSRTQNSTTCDTNLYKRDLLEDPRVHAQNASRTTPITPLALSADNLPDLPTDFSPTRADLSDPGINANGFSQREQGTKSRQTAANICTTTDATVAKHAQGQDSTRHNGEESTSQLSPLLSPVSPTTHSLIYSSKQTSKKSSKKLKSVNKQEMVNIYRMAASVSSRKNQIKGTSVHSPPDSTEQKPCDLLFSFTKSDGKNDLFLVVDDEVFAVKRFDYKGVSYLIHTDRKGKTSILAKLPEEEQLKLQHNDTSASSGQQFPSKRASACNITSTSSKQSRRTSHQRLTPQYHTETSLSVTAPQTFCEENSRDNTPTTFGQRPILDGISRKMGGQGKQKETASLEVNEVLSERQAMHGMRTQSDNERPISFSKSGNLNPERRQLLKQLLNGIRAGTSRRSETPPVTNWPQSVPAGQQHSSSQTCVDRQDRHQGSAVPFNASPNPRSTHAAWNRCGNQQLNVNPNPVDRNQGIDEVNAYSYEQCTNSSAQSTYNGSQAVGTRHQPSEETVDEDSCRNFANSNKSRMSGNRNPERMKLMNYIARRLASKAERASSTVNASPYNQPPSRRSEVERQTSNRTKGNPLSTSATNVSPRRRLEELPPLQQCQRLMELLVGTYNVTANANRNIGGVESSSRKRTAKAIHQVANSPKPLVPLGVMDRLINFEDEWCRKRVATLQAEQQHSLYVDTTSDSLIDDECRTGYTDQQLLNDRKVPSPLHLNQSDTVLSPVSSDGEISGLIQEPKRPGNDTAIQDEQHFTNSVSDNSSMSSSNYHSFMSQTSYYSRFFSAYGRQQLCTAKRPQGHETNVNECLANISFNEAVQRSGSAVQRESVSALISGQQSSTDEAPVRGIAGVAEPSDDEETDTDDGDDVEIVSPPPKRDSTPSTFLDVDDKGNDKSPVEQDAGKISNSALRAELVTKIQATRQRIAQEKVEWKKKYLYRIQTELENKLVKVCCAADVIFIDDD